MKDKGYSTKYSTQGVYFIADVEDLTRDYFCENKEYIHAFNPSRAVQQQWSKVARKSFVLFLYISFTSGTAEGATAAT